MRKVKLIVEYNGRGFHGWQKQPGLRTVQGELQRVLSTVLRRPVSSLHAAGRTDAGVHARGQVVTFQSEDEVDLFRLAAGVSHIMKGELSVVSAEYVPPEFHPGISSTHKQYSYRILNRPTPGVLDAHTMWHIGHSLDCELMEREAVALVGTHDFSAFRDSTCTASSPVKTIYEVRWARTADVVTFYVIGTGFLKQMVRNIIGTLTDIGRGRIKHRSVLQILESRDRRNAGVTAPAHGLCMDWVAYHDYSPAAPRDV